MKRLPDSELEIMMIIWRLGHSATRAEIEKQLGEDRKQLSSTTILSFLSRLEEKGFVEVKKEGKINVYTAAVREQDYLKRESKSILRRMFGNSVRNFIASLYDGENLTQEDMEELQRFIDEKRNTKADE